MILADFFMDFFSGGGGDDGQEGIAFLLLDRGSSSNLCTSHNSWVPLPPPQGS